MSKNMTEAHLDAVMNALPNEMENSELCALTLTIHSAFVETPQEIITNLISTMTRVNEYDFRKALSRN
jgi:hypothetical protein